MSFSITSESGTDYTVSVPEPGQAALALAGGLALAAGGRRRFGRGRPRGTSSSTAT